MSQNEKTRQHETSIEIPVPVEQVWEAIATASGVGRWFAPEVRIDSRPGGEYFVSWGAGTEGTGRIEVFEPGRHLRVVMEREKPGECGGAAGEAAASATPARIAVDYYLEPHQGKTFLRLVNSGFLTTSDWDGEYEGTKQGWPVYLDVLRYSLVRHPRATCRQFFLPAMAAMPVEQAWSRLFGPDGLRAAAPLETLSAGTRYRLELDGEPVEGVIEHWWSPRMFTATWEGLNDACFWMSLMDVKGMAAIGVQMYFYDVPAARFEQVKAGWSGLLGRLFPHAAAA